MIRQSKDNIKNTKEQEQELAKSQTRDFVILGVLVFIWILAIIYFNFVFEYSSPEERTDADWTIPGFKSK